MFRNNRKFVAVFFLLLVTIACIKKTGGTITPFERITTNSALLAEINSAVEQGAEAVATSGLLTPQQVLPVIQFTQRVAIIHAQITAIFAQGQSATLSNAASLNALLSEIQTAGTALVNSGAFGIKNPKTQQAISADIQLVVGYAGTILSDLATLQVTPVKP